MNTKQTKEQPRYWRPRQVAEITNLSPSTIRRAIVSGALEHVRVGQSILVPAEAIERYVHGDGGRAA